MLHDTIRRIRETHNLTQEEVADRLNLAVRSYIRLESGETRLDWDRIRSIAEVYKMSPEDLIAQDARSIIQNFNNNDDSTSTNNGPVYHCNFYGSEKGIYDQLITQLREEISHLREEVAFLRGELKHTRRGES